MAERSAAPPGVGHRRRCTPIRVPTYAQARLEDASQAPLRVTWRGAGIGAAVGAGAAEAPLTPTAEDVSTGAGTAHSSKVPVCADTNAIQEPSGDQQGARQAPMV